MVPLNDEEYLHLLGQMALHHSVFYAMARRTAIFVSDDMPTAAIYFTDDGTDYVKIVVGTKLWESANDSLKVFIIIHEYLHLLYEHGLRGLALQSNYPGENRRINVAMDICINEDAVNHYNVIREDVDPEDAYCWFNKYFPMGRYDSSRGFEYYFKLLEGNENLDSGDTVDDHQPMMEGRINSEAVERILRDVLVEIGEKEANAILSNMGKIAGTSNIKGLRDAVIEARPKKDKWETIIKKWSKAVTRGTNEFDTWLYDNRATMLSPYDVKLPAYKDFDDVVARNDFLEVFFFIDISPSCESYIERFLAVPGTLNPERFKVNVCAFDLQVTPIDVSKKTISLHRRLGTSFSIIESWILNETVKRGKPYPKGVFILTDGYGDTVKPKNPASWYMLLTDKRNKAQTVPEGVSTFQLKDYE